MPARVGAATLFSGGPGQVLSTLVATGLGSGFAPVAPGTFGSLVGLVLFWPLQRLPVPAQLALIAVGYVGGAFASSALARRIGRKDPGLAVVDEVVGMWATLVLLPLTPATAAAGFVLFRLMDVLKPYPARQFEALPEGWGIMTDDLMAGIYANLLLRAGILALG